MNKHASSFRDPSGFIFIREGTVYRQVNACFSEQFERFLECGLYERLVEKGYLISHEDVTSTVQSDSDDCYRILEPKPIPYIAYPYEWSFSQLKDAALLTLRIQTLALLHGFTLKDASAFNIQFLDGKPILIDTLSIEPREDGAPWVGYKQFCEHFLAPLALMAYVDIELSKLAVTYIDGIPLELASKLLPRRTKFGMLQLHIHLHAKAQSAYADSGKRGAVTANSKQLSVSRVQAIVESLASCIERLQWKPPATEWGSYYDLTNYDNTADKSKRSIVRSFLGQVEGPIAVVQDLGANNGEYSRIAAEFSALVVSQDIDPVAVELNYHRIKKSSQKNILPLRQNLCAPSPSIGLNNQERNSFSERARCDVALALALIHHLAISNNVPLGKIADLFADIATWLIIEFVPKGDSQVDRLLATREDIFVDYNREAFEAAFMPRFGKVSAQKIESSDRWLYLYKKK